MPEASLINAYIDISEYNWKKHIPQRQVSFITCVWMRNQKSNKYIRMMFDGNVVKWVNLFHLYKNFLMYIADPQLLRMDTLAAFSAWKIPFPCKRQNNIFSVSLWNPQNKCLNL